MSGGKITNHYSILTKIAWDYICIPSTSVPSEQAFSKSGELISKKRNRLGDSAIEACMCLNSWIKLLENWIFLFFILFVYCF